MAYFSTHRPASNLSGWASEIVRRLSVRMARYRRYRQTFDELNSLSDRELADISVHRSMIPQIAAEAAAQEVY